MLNQIIGGHHLQKPIQSNPLLQQSTTQTPQKFKQLMRFSVNSELEKVNSFLRSLAIKRDIRNSGANFVSAMTNPLQKKRRKKMNVKFQLPEIEQRSSPHGSPGKSREETSGAVNNGAAI